MLEMATKISTQLYPKDLLDCVCSDLLEMQNYHH